MNKGLLTFPNSGQLLRGGDLLKLNKHLNGFPLPAAHPKIVNGLHAFPKQDYEYGVYYSWYSWAKSREKNSHWEMKAADFTIELRCQLLYSSRWGGIGNMNSGTTPPVNTLTSWLIGRVSNTMVAHFRDNTNSLTYNIPLYCDDLIHTHTIVRDNAKAEIRYYLDGLLFSITPISTLLNITVPSNATYAGFNTSLKGLIGVIHYYRQSTIVRDDAFIYNNKSNKYFIDANVNALYNHYYEAGNGTKIINIVNRLDDAGMSGPVWVII